MSTFANFIYQSPTLLSYGKGCVSDIATHHFIPEGARVILLYGGGSIKKNGVYDEVKKYVTPVVEFGGIGPNPHYETCMKAVKVIKENNCDFLLAVGGGSVIDATKFIDLALDWTATADPFDMFNDGMMQKVTKPKAKIGVVLTIPATGTETNNLFVVTHFEKKAKVLGCCDYVKPHFACVDPVHSFTLPVNQVRNGVIDAYVHVIEQYIGHYDVSAVVDQFCEGIMRTLVHSGPLTVKDLHDYKSRADFCLAATYALNGILGTGVQQCWAAHLIGHEITTYYGAAHGASLAMSCPAVMKFNKEKNAKKLAQLAERVYGIKNATAQDGIDCTINFFKSVGGITTMTENKYDEQYIETIAEKFKGRKIGAHQDISYEEVKQIFKLMQ
uniref:Alcohol dehydrogenase, putative n=1 Tax=Entamoeba invadens TaxID=33085 RepID=S0B620_ENTIV|nr:alcohol dehydrogenase, putative [Entamoeba invadens]